MRKIFAPATLILLLSCAHQKKEDIHSYRAGFKTIRTVDSSRIYKPGTDTSDYLHYRPIDLDIWYPAQPEQIDSVLPYKDFLGLLEQRANYYTASIAATGITRQVAQSFCEGLNCSDPDKVLNFKTASYEYAKPSDRKFPLIIYLASYNGMCYENVAFFEMLASKGYVVLSINSIGRYPGDMTMKHGDLMEQVFDAVSSLKFLEASPGIDFEKIGIVGYSWGGLAGTILADKIPNAACLISFDGSEFHHYGQSKEEDAEFDGIRNSDDFRKISLTIPYLRLESSAKTVDSVHSNVYNFREKLAGERVILAVDSAEHQDFCSVPSLVRSSGNCKNNPSFNTITRLAIGFLDEHVKKTNLFAHTLEREMDRSVKKRK